MNLSWHCPTLTLFGADGIAGWLDARPEARHVTVLVDAAVADTPIVSRVRTSVEGPDRDVRVLALDGPGDAESVLALADRLHGSDLVVAVGGGALLDQAKLAALVRDNPAARRRLILPQRSGLVLLPPEIHCGLPVIAVPTTVGTGAELSAAACLVFPQGRRLILGESLRPEVAVLDPLATATLPDELIAEGVLEALFRVVSLYAGDHRDMPTEDALAETLATRLARLGHELRDVRLGGGRSDDRIRLEIAKVSGLTHLGWTYIGRDRYGAKGWYLANELSTALGVRKMTAVAALLEPLWRAIADGDQRLGSARRLSRMWALLRATDPDALPESPAAGIGALTDAWLVGRRISADAARLDTVTARTVRAWGAGLPMLGGLRAADVRGLLDGAVLDAEPALR
ncbi:daptide-type RiPP biosynthesis dehydogenase [Streptomyces erythrochromogenes]|uniref:daptide-type RiPP biosynthesis dehydogenase n=1 Tax=Streptomyces erythrochromogenes TaxID=285574 RepID=UPI0036FC1F42